MNSRRSTLTRGKRLAAVLALAVVAIGLLAGCTRTITVTGKFRSWVGWYFVCNGPHSHPCSKGYYWHVTQSQYNRAQIGHTYTLHF